MRTRSLVVRLVPIVVPSLLLLLGCPKKGDDAADAAAESAAPPPVVEVAEAAAPAAALPPAKNAGDVARFGTEVAVADDDSKLAAAVTQARTGPRQGGVVANLKAGTDVTKVVEYKDCFLVQFADPANASVTLAGWVPKEAFTAVAVVDAGPRDAALDARDAAVVVVDAAVPVDAGHAAAKCAAGQEMVIGLGKDPVCKRKCTADKDCKTGTTYGTCVPATSQGGKVVRICPVD